MKDAGSLWRKRNEMNDNYNENQGFTGGDENSNPAGELKQRLGVDVEPVNSASIEFDTAKRSNWMLKRR